MRGTERYPITIDINHGITPARAGNSHGSTEFRQFLWDHPRACGEQSAGVPIIPQESGSPPRVRGTAYCGGGAVC